MKRLLSISIPENQTVKVMKGEFDINSPYEIVEQLKSNNAQLTVSKDNIFTDYIIADVIPIHNPQGIRNPKKITELRREINAGQEIFEQTGLPNVKLVVAPNNKLLQFDGTHTILAYFLTDRTKLSEIPFLVISDLDQKPVSETDISYFFPKESRETILTDWDKYVVNWEAKPENQLEKREVWSIQDLASQLAKGNKSSVE